MASVGYARVSTKKQTVDAQLDALRAHGCERIFEETMSGARTDRPELKAMLDYVRAGDTVVVWRLDRLGRSLSHVVQTADALHQRGVKIVGLNDGVNYDTPTGQMIAAILAALAQYERTLIAERAEAAREAARSRGKQVGRPRVIGRDQLESIRAMRDAGQSMATICKTTGLVRSTIYNALAEVPTPAT